MTKIEVNGYTLRRLTRKEEEIHQARWAVMFRGELRCFRTWPRAVSTIRKFPPPGLAHIKA